jgi:DNA invertase Pin-like site-specific DNA recombinase
MSENNRVHLYCRVSSAGQEDNTSLATQEAACRVWAAERGLTVASVAREVFSSGELHRPQLDAMIARLQPGDVFLAHKPDRSPERDSFSQMELGSQHATQTSRVSQA